MSRKLSLVFSLVMLMAFAMPVGAAPNAGGAPAKPILANHVANCDTIVIAADGTISVNGVALTAAQAALLSADARAALRLAANADANARADVCVDVALALIPLSVIVNADIAVCGSVVLTANSATVAGVAIPAELISAGLSEALAIAAAANVNACLTTTVTNGSVITKVTLDACVRARLNSAGQVVLTAGGHDFVLAGFVIVGTSGALNASAAVTIGLRIGATLALATEAETLTVQVLAITGCATTPPAGGSTPSGTTPGGGNTNPSAGTNPSTGSNPTAGGAAPTSASTGSGGVDLLPDTAMEAGTVPLAIPSLPLIALLLSGLLVAARMGEDRIR